MIIHPAVVWGSPYWDGLRWWICSQAGDEPRRWHRIEP
jgi:hypothetical protein